MSSAKSSKIYMVCPSCNSGLKISKKTIHCTSCSQKFRVEDGIALMFWQQGYKGKKNVTEKIKSFYEKTPFPNYDGIDSLWSLKEKAKKGIYTHLLHNQIAIDAKILEVGCGTGQLSNILSVSRKRSVYGADICLNSLKLANNFKKKAGLKNVQFVQMNLFSPIFKQKQFDVVISNGVLHHTGDPYLGFQTISKLVRPGGYIIIGLYNRIGRLPTDFRRIIFHLSGGKLKFLDPFLRSNLISDRKKDTWYADQYKNPHESKHSIGEVISWFDRMGFEFVNSIPKPKLGLEFSSQENLFKKNPRGNWFDHLLVETGIALSGGKEGGFFVMIGRKL